MSAPLISICIPAYNAKKYILETLDAVRQQTYPNWELIVVEDGTFDGTNIIVEEWGKGVPQNVVYFKKEVNGGAPSTRNTAFGLTKGAWLLFLDSDDLWLETHLEDLVKTAENNPDCDLVHSGIIMFQSETGEIISQQVLTPAILANSPVSLYDRTYPIQLSATMVTRKFFETVGGFRVDFKYTDDLDFVFKGARSGFNYAFTGNNTYKYRKHGDGITGNYLNIIQGAASVYEAHYDWEAIPLAMRKKYISDHWFWVAKICRTKDKPFAIEAINKALKYKITLRFLLLKAFLSIG